MLSSSQLASETNEIQLNKDGSWSTHVMNSDSQNLDTPHKNFTNVEVISDDLGKFIRYFIICYVNVVLRPHLIH